MKTSTNPENKNILDDNFKILIENSPDIIMRLDLNHKILYINRTTSGYTKEDVIGTSVFNYFEPKYHKLVKDKYKEAIQKGITVYYVIESIGLDGIKYWYNSKVSPIIIEDKIIGLNLFTRDITVEKILEEKSLANKLKYKNLYENSPIGIYSSNRSGKILNANLKFANIFGYESIDEILQINMIDLYYKKDEREKIINENSNNRATKGIEIQFKKKDGSPIWILMNGIAKLNKKDNTYDFDGFVLDINENKLNELKLIGSEIRYKAVIDSLQEGIVIQNAELLITDANSSAEKILGVTIDQMQGRTLCDIRMKCIHEDGNDYHGNTSPSAISVKTGLPLTNQIMGVYKPDDTLNWISINSVPLFNKESAIPIGVVCSFNDITESKKANEDLLLFKKVIENAHGGILIADALVPNSPIIYINDRFQSLTGYSSNEMIGKTCKILQGKDSDENVINEIRFSLKEKKNFAGELLNYRKDGTPFWNSLRITTIKDKNDIVTHFIGFQNDISLRKKAEYNLIDKQKSFETIFNFSPLPKLIVNFERDEITMVNNNFSNLIGLEPLDLIGRKVTDIYYDISQRQEVLKILSEFQRVNNFEFKLKKSDGSYVECLLSSALLTINNEKVILITIVDLSNIKKKEQEIKLLNKSTLDFRNAIYKSSIISITDINGNIVFINDNFIKICGYSKNELLGTNHRITNSGFHTKLFWKKMWKTISSGNIWRNEIKNKSKDGSYFWVDTFIIPLKDDFGNVIEYISIRNDNTLRKKAESNLIEREKTLEAIFNFSPLPLIISKIENGEIIKTNRKIELLIGIEPNGMIGRFTTEFYYDLSQRGEVLNALFEKDRIDNFEYRLKIIDGSLVECLLSSVFIEVNNEKVILSSIVDISKTKENEKEILKAKETAEEMNRLKTNFLANMSHELRTPMNGILGFSQLLTMTDEIEDVNEVAKLINDSSKRLMHTLNLILDISAIESGSMKLYLENLDLIEIVSHNLSLFSATVIEKKLKFTFDFGDEEIHIFSNKQALDSIFSNLINNAVKFTNIGGIHIDIKIIDNLSKPKSVIIKIIDTGIGISENDFELIFDEFRQASEGISRSFEGNGLGLSLTKKYVNILNGTINLESKLNVGSTFIIELPFEFSNESNPLVQNTQSNNSNKTKFMGTKTKKSILLVEDDYTSVKLIEFILKNDYDIDVTVISDDALEQAKAKQYDLIITDINLGRGNNGLWLTKEIKKLSNYKKIPVIAMTAYAMISDKEEFLEAGCDDYISKPIDYKDFLSLVEKYLNKEEITFRY